MEDLMLRTQTPFPLQLPHIEITPTDTPPFEVDFKEMHWWFAIPEVGDHVLWAQYEPDLRLSDYTELKALRPAKVHGIDCVELAAMVYDHAEDPVRAYPWMFFSRLTEDRVQYLATLSLYRKDLRELRTMLDEGFDKDWGDGPRHIRQTGRLMEQSDGSYALSAGADAAEIIEPTGVFRVMVGDRSFECLRVIGITVPLSEENALEEAYLTREGRTIMFRRYNGTRWNLGYNTGHPKEMTWDQRFPDHKRIIINGVTFVHWYDCLSNFACGIEAGE